MFDNLFTTYLATKPSMVSLNVEETELLYKHFMLSSSHSVGTPSFEISSNPFEIKAETPEVLQQLEVTLLTYNTEDIKTKLPKKSVLKGSKGFEEAFQKAVEINPEVSKYRNFLVKTAERESGFDSNIQNSAGAPYYGYFQMGKDEIKRTTGLSVEEFRNDPVQQILGAVKLYDINLRTIKAIGVYNIGKEKGYSDDALVSGAWMGGPGGVKKYLLGQGDPSDSHWYKDGKGGSSVGKIMNNWKASE